MYTNPKLSKPVVQTGAQSSQDPRSLEKGCRSERALKLAIAQMYVEGVSTRKVTEITEVLCGFEIPSTQVSRLSSVLDEELDIFRTLPLGEYLMCILMLDMKRGAVGKIAVGVCTFGKRHVLGVSAPLSEAEVHWRSFLQSLVNRALRDIKLIVSDDHNGLKAAREAVLSSTLWQRCPFQSKSKRTSVCFPKRVSSASRLRFAGTMEQQNYGTSTHEQTEAFILKWQDKSPNLAELAQDNLEEGFICFLFPKKHRKRINQEFRRRTRVARLFPDERSCLRLITAVLAEIHDEWSTDRTYLNMSLLDNVNLYNKIYRKFVA